LIILFITAIYIFLTIIKRDNGGFWRFYKFQPQATEESMEVVDSINSKKYTRSNMFNFDGYDLDMKGFLQSLYMKPIERQSEKSTLAKKTTKRPGGKFNFRNWKQQSVPYVSGILNIDQEKNFI